MQIAQSKHCFTFVHPNRDEAIDNTRYGLAPACLCVSQPSATAAKCGERLVEMSCTCAVVTLVGPTGTSAWISPRPSVSCCTALAATSRRGCTRTSPSVRVGVAPLTAWCCLHVEQHASHSVRVSVTAFSRGLLLSPGIDPLTFSEGMFSWFPLYFPIRVSLSACRLPLRRDRTQQFCFCL